VVQFFCLTLYIARFEKVSQSLATAAQVFIIMHTLQCQSTASMFT